MSTRSEPAMEGKDAGIRGIRFGGSNPPSIVGTTTTPTVRGQHCRTFSLGSDRFSGQMKPLDSSAERAAPKSSSIDGGSWNQSYSRSYLKRSRPVVIVKPRRQFVRPGDTATFRVSFEGEPRPQVTWLKDGHQLHSTGRHSIFEYDGIWNVLEIANVSPLDTGSYSSVVSNELGSETHDASLDVIGVSKNTAEINHCCEAIKVNSPVKTDSYFDNNRHLQTITIRKLPADLSCDARISDAKISDTKTSDTKSSDTKSSDIRLSDVQSSDANMSGAHSFVQRSDDMSNENLWNSKKSELVVNRMSRAQLRISIAQPQQAVSTVAEDVDSIDRRSRRGFVEVSSNVSRAENGSDPVDQSSPSRECQGKGHDSRTFRSVAVSPPTFARKLKSTTVQEGDPFCFSCQVTGHPMIKWEKDGKEISQSRYKMDSLDGEERLSVERATSADCGRYVCIASNAGGTVRSMGSLMVQRSGAAGTGRQSNDFRSSIPSYGKTSASTDRTGSSGSNGLSGPVVSSFDGAPDERNNNKDDRGVEGWMGRTSTSKVFLSSELRRDNITGPEHHVGVPVIVSTSISDYPADDHRGRDKPALRGTNHFVNSVDAVKNEAAVDDGFVDSVVEPVRSLKPEPRHQIAVETSRSGIGIQRFRAAVHRLRRERVIQKQGVSAPERNLCGSETADSCGFSQDGGSVFDCSPALKSGEFRPVRFDSETESFTSDYLVTPISGERGMDCQLMDVMETEEPPLINDLQPENLHTLRGSEIRLTSSFVGIPLPEAAWFRDTEQLHPDDRIHTLLDSSSATLVISDARPSDTGRYTLTVKNELGMDRLSSSVTVEDKPDPPPGQPAVTSITRTSVVLSWYGSGYDGGSPVLNYKIESSCSGGDWELVTDRCIHTSYQVDNLSADQHYRFRVSTGNKHGFSEPGEPSDTVITLDKKTLPGDEHPFKPRNVVVQPGRKFADYYTVGEVIGKGKFGSVHLCKEKGTDRELAAKFIRVKTGQREEFRQEIEVMNELHHTKLLLLWDAFESTREIVLVMEYISGHELLERVINDDYELTEKECIHFLRQICEGVEYMHSKDILHLDLKPENILCVTLNSNEIKIIDFGLARRYDPKKTNRVMSGTPEFAAPEVINYDQIGYTTDMWSVGVICYILLTGLSPFQGDNDSETFANVIRAEYDLEEEEAFEEISEDAKDFIRKLLLKNPKHRMTAKLSLDHSWLSQDVTYMRAKRLSTDKHKRLLAKRKWQKSGNAIRALGRITRQQKLGFNGSIDLDQASMDGCPGAASSVSSDPAGGCRPRSPDPRTAGGRPRSPNPRNQSNTRTRSCEMKLNYSVGSLPVPPPPSETTSGFSSAGEDNVPTSVITENQISKSSDGILDQDNTVLKRGSWYSSDRHETSELPCEVAVSNGQSGHQSSHEGFPKLGSESSYDAPQVEIQDCSNDTKEATSIVVPGPSSSCSHTTERHVSFGESPEAQSSACTSQEVGTSPDVQAQETTKPLSCGEIFLPLSGEKEIEPIQVPDGRQTEVQLDLSTKHSEKQPEKQPEKRPEKRPELSTETKTEKKSESATEPHTETQSPKLISEKQIKMSSSPSSSSSSFSSSSSSEIKSTRVRSFVRTSESQSSFDKSKAQSPKVGKLSDNKQETEIRPKPKSSETEIKPKPKPTTVLRNAESKFNNNNKLNSKSPEVRVSTGQACLNSALRGSGVQTHSQVRTPRAPNSLVADRHSVFSAQNVVSSKPKKPPVFVRRIRDLQISEGGVARMEAVVDGNPAPTVLWFKDGKEIVPTPNKYDMESLSNGKYVLVIRDCGEDDDAEYDCKATSTLGNVSCKANLYVEPIGEDLDPANSRSNKGRTHD